MDEDGRERIFHGVNAVYKVRVGPNPAGPKSAGPDSGPPRSQGAPWHAPVLEGFDPTQSFSDIDMRVLRRFGVTAVRLGMMWPGVEPQRGQCVSLHAPLRRWPRPADKRCPSGAWGRIPGRYNDTYLGVMSGIVSRLRDHGIYAILDWHQDGLSGKVRRLIRPRPRGVR